MRAISTGEAKHGHQTLEILNYTTFGSLIKRGYVTVDGRSNPTFTDAGYKAYATYQELDMPTRGHAGPMTETVELMLKLQKQRAMSQKPRRMAAAS